MTGRAFSLIASLTLVAGCGAAPSAPSSVSTAATQTAVASAITQAVSQAAIVAPTSGDVVNAMTVPCPDGGSMTLRYSAAMPTAPTSSISTSSRTEFNDCKNRDVTIN